LVVGSTKTLPPPTPGPIWSRASSGSLPPFSFELGSSGVFRGKIRETFTTANAFEQVVNLLAFGLLLIRHQRLAGLRDQSSKSKISHK